MQLKPASDEKNFPDLNEYPIENLLRYRIYSGLDQNIILPEDIPLACQINLTKNLAQHIRSRLEMEYKIAGFYLGEHQDHPFLKAIDQLRTIEESLRMSPCQSVDQSFDSDPDCQNPIEKIITVVQETDDTLQEVARIIRDNALTIQRRFKEGLIPSCLLNDLTMACAHDPQNNNCLTQLQNLWWDSDYRYNVFDPELVVEKPSSGLIVDASKTSDLPPLFSGGFHHLLFSQALTCSSGIQKGGTCAIYSGTSLLSPYCDTPAKNPLLGEESCGDTGPGYCCVSDKDVLQKAFDLGLWKAKTVDAQGRVLGPSEEGINDLEPNEVRLFMPGQEPTFIQGRSGAYVADMGQVYRTFGFEAKSHNVNNFQVDWDAILASLDAGHPVQIGYYYDNPKNLAGPKSSHAVILEGHLLKKWLFVRNSNLTHIQVFDINDLKTKNPVHTAISVRPIVNFNSMAPACQQ